MKATWTIFAASMGLAILTACEQGEPEAPPEAPPTPVEVETAARATVVDRLVLNAVIRPQHSTRLASGTGGKVDAVLADDGDRISKGQLLAKIAAGLAAAQLKQAEAGLATAKGSYDRVYALKERGLASSSTVEQITSTLAQAEAAQAMARVRYDDAMVRAPHSGFIARRHISVGEFAAPGNPLFDLVDTSVVKVIAQIPERDAPLIEEGRAAEVFVDALPDRAFSGSINRLGIVASEHARTFDIEVRINNADGALRPGMLSRLTVIRQTLEDVVTTRRDAVFEDVGGRNVFIATDGRAVQRAVRIGPVDGDRVAILEGIDEGEPVVVVGQRALVNQQPINVVRDQRGDSRPKPTEQATDTDDTPIPGEPRADAATDEGTEAAQGRP